MDIEISPQSRLASSSRTSDLNRVFHRRHSADRAREQISPDIGRVTLLLTPRKLSSRGSRFFRFAWLARFREARETYGLPERFGQEITAHQGPFDLGRTK